METKVVVGLAVGLGALALVLAAPRARATTLLPRVPGPTPAPGTPEAGTGGGTPAATNPRGLGTPRQTWYAATWADAYPVVPFAVASTDPGLVVLPTDEQIASNVWQEDPALARAVQAQLKALGFYAGNLDGNFGHGSALAVNAYATWGERLGRTPDPTIAEILHTLALDYVTHRQRGMPFAS